MFHLISSGQRKLIINACKLKLQENPNVSFRSIRKSLKEEWGISEKTISNTISGYNKIKNCSQYFTVDENVNAKLSNLRSVKNELCFFELVLH